MENILAIVDENSRTSFNKLAEKLHKYNVNLIITMQIIEGFSLYITKDPILIILDEANKGFTIAKTVFDAENKKSPAVYMMINEASVEEKDGIDFFLLKPISYMLLEIQIKAFLKKYFRQKNSAEIERARQQQLSKLPVNIDNEYLKMSYLYSPFNKLSGDYIKIFEYDGCFYGVVFDCAGHDLLAWQQTGIVEITFNYAIKFLKQKIVGSLSEMIAEVNKSLVTEEIFVAAMIFKIDPANKKMTYISAGIPSFFVKEKDEVFKEIPLQGKIIGYQIDTKYEEKEYDLKDVKELVFSSDGFSDIFVSEEDQKTDDVSALFVQIK